MAEDLRTRVTKQLIADCFIDQLETTALSKITVKSICDSAEINRATFYRYYANPRDLFDSIERHFFDQVKDLTVKAIRSNADPDRFKEALMDLLVFYQRNSRMILAVRAQGEDDFSAKLMRAMYSYMVSASPHLTYENLSDEENGWLYQFMASGVASMVFSWLESDMKAPIETVADFLLACSEGIHSRILKR